MIQNKTVGIRNALFASSFMTVDLISYSTFLKREEVRLLHERGARHRVTFGIAPVAHGELGSV